MNLPKSIHLRPLLRVITKTVKLVRNLSRRVVWCLLDAGETLLGKKDALTPPRHLMNVGTNRFTRSDFSVIGQELFGYLVDIGGVKPDDKVLDVGCGVGRMAIPLTRYLSTEGRYDGFDIVAESVDHCTRTITPNFQNFRFHHANLFNTHYNPTGKFLPHSYKFPFPDETFSFVFLTSVFTHMLSEEVHNYIKEIRRVLVPDGRCFITYFLINPDSEKLMQFSSGSPQFQYPIDHGRSTHVNEPEAAVAFDESYIRTLYRTYGLIILDPVRYGSWCGRTTNVGYQDIIVAVKNAENLPDPN